MPCIKRSLLPFTNGFVKNSMTLFCNNSYQIGIGMCSVSGCSHRREVHVWEKSQSGRQFICMSRPMAEKYGHRSIRTSRNSNFFPSSTRRNFMHEARSKNLFRFQLKIYYCFKCKWFLHEYSGKWKKHKNQREARENLFRFCTKKRGTLELINV